MLKARALGLFLFFLLIQQHVFGQSSLVPVYHEVYDWLHYQRVRGNAPHYNYEALPLTRGQITDILASIEPNNISANDNHVRTSYLREFSVDSLKKMNNYTLFQGDEKVLKRVRDGLFSPTEPHIYVWHNEFSTSAVDMMYKPSATFVTDGDKTHNSPYYHAIAIRTYGTLSGIAGFHYEQYGLSNSKDMQTFRYLPFYGRSAKYLRAGISPNHLEAYAGFAKNFWSLHIGRGTLKYGVGKKDNLIFSRESIPFDWLRINIDSKYVKYSMVYGFLTWPPTNTRISGYSNLNTRTSPSRYTVHQRIKIQPAPWISFGYYDMVNYSNREFEITYLNPVNRLAIMEFEQDDQDNGFAGFEGSLRPIKGLEIYGEMLIDDLGNTNDIFRWNNKKASGGNSLFARHLGTSYALKSGQVFNINYQRVEPSLYAHKYPLNAHTEAGIVLGSQIGPNGDELSFNVDQWLSHRSRVSFGYTFNRHALNYYDENGDFIDAGGDANTSYYLDPETGATVRATEFLEGDLHTWNRIFAEAVYEPWRGIKFLADISYRNINKGDQLNDQLIFTIGFVIGE